MASSNTTPCGLFFVASTSLSLVLAAAGCGGGGDPSTSAGGSSSSASASGGSGSGGAPSSGTTTSSGSSSGSGPGGCGSPTPGATSACASYAPTTIAAMRAAKTSGCFEIQHVGLVSRTDSPTEPRIYVQDKNGGDFSAILGKCTTTATHGCAAPVRTKIGTLLDTKTDGAQLTIRGYYTNGAVSQFENVLIEDILDECATIPRPAPITMTVAEIQRDARTPAKWFRRAHVTIPQNDPLVMYDFSPLDLQAPTAGCPDVLGFAMIPQSAGAAAATGCVGGSSPPAQPNDPREVLVGRQFFNQFLFSTDCACVAGSGQKLVSPTGKVSGTVTGYLIIETDVKSTASYQVFEAAANQSFPIQ